MLVHELISLLEQMPPEREIFADHTKPGAKMLSLYPINVVMSASIESGLGEEEVVILSYEDDNDSINLN